MCTLLVPAPKIGVLQMESKKQNYNFPGKFSTDFDYMSVIYTYYQPK
jgi:hypothetical protein